MKVAGLYSPGMMVAVGSAVLQVTCGAGRAIVRPGRPVIIGRDVGCDLQVEGRLVSRRHAEVDVAEDGWVVRDLGSRNGTFVDGEKAAFVAVVDGGEIRLGSATDGPVVRFQILPEESSAPVSPAPLVAEVVAGPPPEAPQEAASHASPPPSFAAPPPGLAAPPPGFAAPPEEFAPPAFAAPPPEFAAPPEEFAPPAFAAPPPEFPPPSSFAAPPVDGRGAGAAVVPGGPGGNHFAGIAASAGAVAQPVHGEAPEHREAAAAVAAQSVAPALAARAPMAEHDAAGGRIRIGRGPDNDIVLADLRTSRNHAELRRTAEGFEVVDLGSRNGTFHNGQQVGRAMLAPGDMVSIGRHEFLFDGHVLHEFEDTGPVSLVADDLTVQIKKARLIDDISFALPEGSLLAVIGPSGCGKSTLLRAVTGLRPATRGKVHYDGRDLYADYAELRYRIGLVPQDDVLHRQLTVRRALRFAAALRFADDVPRNERNKRVEEVLDTLNLTERAKQRIDTLSGGQRKRVSVALELLTEPSLLFLDEPTSGLDPALDKEVMQELRELADRGRAVIVVTHNVLHLDLTDRVLVMCAGGRMGYFGPPEELLAFFGAPDYAEVFGLITDDPDTWADRYRQSPLYDRYVTKQMAASVAAVTMPAAPPVPAPAPGRVPAPGPAPVPAPGSGPGSMGAPGSGPPAPDSGLNYVPTRPVSRERPTPPAPATTGALSPSRSYGQPPPPAAPARANAVVGRAKVKLGGGLGRALHPSAPLRQFLTLCLRMLWVIAADRGYSLFLFGLPCALALLVHTVPGENGLSSTLFNLEAERLLVVLVIGAAFLGTAAAIREIVNESTIYKRERAVGLSAGAYLASKVVVFSVIICGQTALFTWLSLLGKKQASEPLVAKQHPLFEIMVPVALVALASMTIGLLVSTLARTTEQTTPVLVVLVMAQLVLCGGLFELEGSPVMEQVAWLFPTRWGLAAGASTVDLQKLIRLHDSLWNHTVFSWWRSILLLLLLFGAFIAATRVALRRLEPGRE